MVLLPFKFFISFSSYFCSSLLLIYFKDLFISFISFWELFNKVFFLFESSFPFLLLLLLFIYISKDSSFSSSIFSSYLWLLYFLFFFGLLLKYNFSSFLLSEILLLKLLVLYFSDNLLFDDFNIFISPPLFEPYKLSNLLEPFNFPFISYNSLLIMSNSLFILLFVPDLNFAPFFFDIVSICLSISLNLFFTIALLLLSLFIWSINIGKTSESSNLCILKCNKYFSSSKSTGTIKAIYKSSSSGFCSRYILFFEYAVSKNFINLVNDVYFDFTKFNLLIICSSSYLFLYIWWYTPHISCAVNLK